jgi:hypothetical protein
MKILTSVFALYCSLWCYAQSDSIAHTVFLIGDAGNDVNPCPCLQLLEKMSAGKPNTSVIFLGDNVYPKGLDGKKSSEQKLLTQLNAVSKVEKVFVIPGNHDWLAQAPRGKKAIVRQQLFVDSVVKIQAQQLSSNDHGGFYPKQGKPGPFTTHLSPQLRLVIIDTQWWIQGYPLHRVDKSTAPAREQYRQLLFRLDSILKVAQSKNETIIIAAHHPLFTNGTHAGNKFKAVQWLVNYTPFQVFGLLGANRVLSQEMTHPRYKKMRRDLLSIIEKYNNIIYTAGHDHNLQYFQMSGNRHFIVSGSGSKMSKLHNKPFVMTHSNDAHPGFFRIEFLRNGQFNIYMTTVPDQNVKVN